MNSIHCLVVDDEPLARQIIEQYCSHLPQLKVVGSCSNALEAKQILQGDEVNVDLIFLDINMPVLDGIAFLKTLKHPPHIIFTTAYKEYATDAFDLSVTDYLVKPFSLERFILAIDKVISKQRSHAPGYIFIKADGKIYQILFDELLYAEANGNYTRLVLQQQTLLPAMTFLAMEEMLPSAQFIRVHRSFIINKTKI